MDHTRSLPYYRVVRQTGRGSGSDGGGNSVQHPRAHSDAPVTVPHASPRSLHYPNPLPVSRRTPRRSLRAPKDQHPVLPDAAESKGTWFVMDVAQGTTFGCHVAQVNWLVNDLNLSVRERKRQ